MKIIKTEDFLNTMNLPRKTIPVDGELVKRQGYFLDKIRNDSKYIQAIKKNSINAKRYRFANFPVDIKEVLEPTVVFNQILKDIYIRYAVLSGNIVSDNITFIDNGVDLEEKYDVVDKKDKKLDSRKIAENLKAKQLARVKIINDLKKQINEINALGTILNYNENYNSTAEGNIESIVIDKFLELYNKKQIYRSFRPIYWCPSCKESIDKSNVNFKKEKINNYYILYKVKSDKDNKLEGVDDIKNVYFIANTILPWTMISSDYIALASDVEYSLVQVIENNYKMYYIIASDKVEQFMSYKFYIKYVVIKTFGAADLLNVQCYNPLNYNKSIGIILSDRKNILIDKENNSGIRIVSSGHTYVDYLIYKEAKMRKLKCVINEDGKTNSLALVYNNMNYIEVNKRVIEFLKNNNFIYYSLKVSTARTYCKKCGEKLIYRSISEWYLKKHGKITEEQYKNIISNMNASQKYKEEELKKQVEKINNEEEVVISDRREIGIPIPVFYCASCGHEIVGDKINQIIGNLFREKGSETWYKSTPEQILQGQIGCKNCGGTFLFKDDGSLNEFFKELSIPFILDNNAINGSLCLESKERFYKKLKQISFNDNIDQTFGKLEKIMIHSSVDENMKKNIDIKENEVKHHVNNKKKKYDLTIAKENDIKSDIAIKRVISTYGTDILRLWTISKSNDNKINLNDQYMINTKKKYMGIRRTFKFMLSNLTDFNPIKNYINVEQRNDIDKLIYSKLLKLDTQINQNYNNLNLKKVYDLLIKFCLHDLCGEYFESIKYRLYVLRKDNFARRSTQSSLYDILMSLVVYFEPIIPFTLEEVWPYIWHSNDSETHNILLYRKNLKNVDLSLEQESKKWEKIYKLKNSIKKHLAKAKVTKIINEKIEATVIINTDEEDKKFIEENYEDIRATLGVSNIIVNISEERKVQIVKSEGTQCRRCRQYSIYIGQNLKYTYLCPKCAEILES